MSIPSPYFTNNAPPVNMAPIGGGHHVAVAPPAPAARDSKVIVAQSVQRFHVSDLRRTSVQAANIDMSRQSWYRPTWNAVHAIRYLEKAPKGAFVIRNAPENAEDLAMSVQTGRRICHALLKIVEVENGKYWRMNPNPRLFEHLYDLVIFCATEGFSFRSVDPNNMILLNLNAARKAEEINRTGMVMQHKNNLREIERQVHEQELDVARAGNVREVQDKGQTQLREHANRLFAQRRTWQLDVQTRLATCAESIEALQAMTQSNASNIPEFIISNLASKLERIHKSLLEGQSKNKDEAESIKTAEGTVNRLFEESDELAKQLDTIKNERFMAVAGAAGQLAQAQRAIQQNMLPPDDFVDRLLTEIQVSREKGGEDAVVRKERHECLTAAGKTLSAKITKLDVSGLEKAVTEAERSIGVTLAKLAMQGKVLVDVENQTKSAEEFAAQFTAICLQHEEEATAIISTKEPLLKEKQVRILETETALDTLDSQAEAFKDSAAIAIVGQPKISEIEATLQDARKRNKALRTEVEDHLSAVEELQTCVSNITTLRNKCETTVKEVRDQLTASQEKIAAGAAIEKSSFTGVNEKLEVARSVESEMEQVKVQLQKSLSRANLIPMDQVKEKDGEVDCPGLKKKVQTLLKSINQARSKLAAKALRMLSEAAELGEQLGGNLLDNTVSDEGDEDVDSECRDWMMPITQLLSGKKVEFGVLTEAVKGAERYIANAKKKLENPTATMEPDQVIEPEPVVEEEMTDATTTSLSYLETAQGEEEEKHEDYIPIAKAELVEVDFPAPPVVIVDPAATESVTDYSAETFEDEDEDEVEEEIEYASGNEEEEVIQYDNGDDEDQSCEYLQVPGTPENSSKTATSMNDSGVEGDLSPSPIQA